MLTLNITLARRPPDDTIQSYTEASYLATCSDIGLFFHDTWSHLRLSRATGNGAINLLISPETNESSIFEVMSTLAKQLLLKNSEGKQQQQSIDDFDDFITPSPSRMGTRRTRGDSLDESESLYSLPPKPKRDYSLFSGDDHENRFMSVLLPLPDPFLLPSLPSLVSIVQQMRIQILNRHPLTCSKPLPPEIFLIPRQECFENSLLEVCPLPSPALNSLPSHPAPPVSNVEDHSGGTGGSNSELNSENVPPPTQLQHRLSSSSSAAAAAPTANVPSPSKPTFVERSTLQQDITRGQIIPSTFQPVTIIWNKRLDIKERNLIINNYNTSGSVVHESLLLDNTALPNANGNVSISISTPKTSRSMASPVIGSGHGAVGNRSVPWSTIRQNLEEGNGASGGASGGSGGSYRII